METATLVLNALVLAAVVALGLLWKLYLPAYITEKGKNLATKEDVAAITHQIEGVKAAFTARLTRFTVFHQRQFKVIGGTYKRLRHAQALVSHMVNPVQSGGDPEEVKRQQAAQDAFNALAEYYWGNKIYLPESLCSSLEPVVKTIQMAYLKYQIARASGNENPNRFDHWEAAEKAMSSEVPAALTELEKAMRDLVTETMTLEEGRRDGNHGKLL